MNVNGSVRAFVEMLRPARYVGVDIAPGRGVDEIVPAEKLLARFGVDAFDVVICTEMMEHARLWRDAVLNMKSVLKPGGVMVLTTRSVGFPYHGWPDDYWRYEPDDVRAIFIDFELSTVERDSQHPGVFLKARKPVDWQPADLGGVALYSSLTHERETGLDSLSDDAVARLQARAGDEAPVNWWDPLSRALGRVRTGPLLVRVYERRHR